MEPGRREPAPPPSRIVQELVNTRDVMERTDALDSSEALHAWAVERGLLDEREPVGADDPRRVREFREALRALLLAHNGGGLDAGVTGSLDAAARVAGITLRFDGSETCPTLVASSAGIDGLVGTIILAVHEASRSGQWKRLKACREPSCRWAFYDHSRNSASHWCTMSMCGGRSKARAYRKRKRTGAAATKAPTAGA
jgi:predicted RNA-binding Zn ribbon-like protein